MVQHAWQHATQSNDSSYGAWFAGVRTYPMMCSPAKTAMYLSNLLPLGMVHTFVNMVRRSHIRLIHPGRCWCAIVCVCVTIRTWSTTVVSLVLTPFDPWSLLRCHYSDMYVHQGCSALSRSGLDETSCRQTRLGSIVDREPAIGAWICVRATYGMGHQAHVPCMAALIAYCLGHTVLKTDVHHTIANIAQPATEQEQVEARSVGGIDM